MKMLFAVETRRKAEESQLQNQQNSHTLPAFTFTLLLWSFYFNVSSRSVKMKFNSRSCTSSATSHTWVGNRKMTRNCKYQVLWKMAKASEENRTWGKKSLGDGPHSQRLLQHTYPNPSFLEGETSLFSCFLSGNFSDMEFILIFFPSGGCDNVLAWKAYWADPKRTMYILISYYLDLVLKKKTHGCELLSPWNPWTGQLLFFF